MYKLKCLLVDFMVQGATKELPLTVPLGTRTSPALFRLLDVILYGHGRSHSCADPICRVLHLALLLLHPDCCCDNFLPIKMQLRPGKR